jgi:predicted transcriptional regulator
MNDGIFINYSTFVNTIQSRTDQILATIKAMEAEDMTPRGTRESLLAMALSIAQAQGKDEAWLMDNNIAYRKFKIRDEEIKKLREECLSLQGSL